MNSAEVAANYAQTFLMRSHRGVYECEDHIIIFGNDAYTNDARSQREVELMQVALPAHGITESEFGVSNDGISWAIVADNQDGIDLRELEFELWGCWFGACEAGLPKVIRCEDHSCAPWAVTCIHIIEGTATDVVPIVLDEGTEVEADWLCPECVQKHFGDEWDKCEIADLRAVCIHCLRQVLEPYQEDSHQVP